MLNFPERDLSADLTPLKSTQKNDARRYSRTVRLAF